MSAVTDIHNPDLGGNIRHGDTNTFCPRLWEYLIERFAVHSVLDVGCGEGHAVDWFRRHGVIAHGIEGLLTNLDHAVTPIAWHDLKFGPCIMPVDMVWSCEVAEHIEARYVDYYIDSLCNGRIVAMTHATPGQGGWHHVNEQPAEYWITLMKRRGYDLHPDSMYCRQVEPGSTYFGVTGLVFTRG